MYTKRGILFWEAIGVGIIVLANLITASISPIGYPVVSTPICVGIAIAATFYGSGAHLNPTVTGLITIFAKIRWSRIFIYLASAFGSAALIGSAWRLGEIAILLPPFGQEHADFGAVIAKEALATLCLLSYLSVFIFLERGIFTVAAVPVFLSLIQLTALGGADMNPAVSFGWLVVGKYGLGSFGAHLLGEAIAIGALLIVGLGLRTWRRRVVAKRHGAFQRQTVENRR